jgi:DNA-binding LytR/AlgR family response regulator
MTKIFLAMVLYSATFVEAVDYLLKPFSCPRFDEAMQRLLHHLETDSRSPNYANRLAMKSGEEFILINVNDIDWISSSTLRSMSMH